jgi:Fic family protein
MSLSDLGATISLFLKEHPGISSKTLYEGINEQVSYATVKRELQHLLSSKLIVTSGRGKATKYALHEAYSILVPIQASAYFQKDLDQRSIKRNYDFQLIQIFARLDSLFTVEEKDKLTALQVTFTKRIGALSGQAYKREFERLAIDLSWKSSQIEGNTYTLLETERLIKDKITASGRTRDEATMILNHKAAFDFIMQHPETFERLSVRAIEEVHSLLIADLNIPRNIRHSRVGITGTNYQPLDNEYQINEALHDMCKLINHRQDVFEKALLALVLISYIQPFEDGNKRTARLISNAMLLQGQHCPLSFRTVDPIYFKEAMLIFYEQNNISVIKEIFIEQYAFAVETYL